MIRIILISLILAFSLSSPGFRFSTAKFLRQVAEWIAPDETDSPNNNPSHFKIPNPFYVEEVEN